MEHSETCAYANGVEVDGERVMTGCDCGAVSKWTRSVQNGCPKFSGTFKNGSPVAGKHGAGPGCACHPHVPVPCDECYSIEVFSRRIPYEVGQPRHEFRGRVTIEHGGEA